MRRCPLLIGLRRIGMLAEREQGLGPIGGEVEERVGRDVGAALGGCERLARAIGRGLRPLRVEVEPGEAGGGVEGRGALSCGGLFQERPRIVGAAGLEPGPAGGKRGTRREWRRRMLRRELREGLRRGCPLLLVPARRAEPVERLGLSWAGVRGHRREK
jgi:hypothetical protein